jgi:hypothetical protein
MAGKIKSMSQCNTDHPENECVCGRVLTNDAREIAPCGCQKCVKCWQQSRDDEDDAFPCSICGEEDIINWLEDNYEPNYNNSLSARMQRDFQQKEVDQKQQVNMAAESFVSWFKINRTKKVSEFAEDMPPNYMEDGVGEMRVYEACDDIQVQLWQSGRILSDRHGISYVFAEINNLRRYAVIKRQREEVEQVNNEAKRQSSLSSSNV